MEKTIRPSLNLDFTNSNLIIYPEINKNDYFLITPIIKIVKINSVNNNNTNNSPIVNLKRKRSESF
jgi:hypothetical protein